MAGLIDPTVTGKYPVILGDGLLGKSSNDIFTGIRYNHKPSLSSPDAPSQARLKPSVPGKTDSYDLSFTDDDGSYAYSGTRNTDSSQYVLHFDPERKVFILDKMDSMFNMNVTRLPGASDSDRLRRQYPHLESQASPQKPKSKPGVKKPATKENTSSNTQPSSAKSQAKEPKRKTEKVKQQAKEVALSFPEPAKEEPKAKQKPKSFDDEDEEEEDDDDGGLLIEYPGAETAARKTDFSPAFPPPRRFDDFMDQRESEADDADGESDDEVDMDFKLPSPVNHQPRSQPDPEPMNEDGQNDQEEFEDNMDDMEGDLEKEMELAFEDVANSQEEMPQAGDESEISEED